MERTYKFLQITALIITLLAPPIFFVGYAYDWGYLDSFKIDHQMFSKSPQEYFGYAVIVIFLASAKLFQFLFAENIFITLLALLAIAVIVFSYRYLLHRPKLWSKIYLRWSNRLEPLRRRMDTRMVESVASAYLLTVLPVLIVAGGGYFLLLIVSPGLIGYGKGQDEAKRLKSEWCPNLCAPNSNTVGCTQILEAGKVVAQGKLIVASENSAAIFDGNSVQIYSLRKRDIRTLVSHQ